jgi:hypothetical protein
MSSNAYKDYLTKLLDDAQDIVDAHKRLRTGKKGRQWGLGGLNRAVVVMSVSAWEAYFEEVVREGVAALRPAMGPLGAWSSLRASVDGLVGRFNTPNAENVRLLVHSALGLEDVTRKWSWKNTTPHQARTRLNRTLRQRHQIAHGVNPRPIVHNGPSSRLPAMFRQLGRCTDSAIRDYLVNHCGVTSPWP